MVCVPFCWFCVSVREWWADSNKQMAVVEAGSHVVRCGSIGEATCTFAFAPMFYHHRIADNEEASQRDVHPHSKCRYSWQQLLTDNAFEAHSAVPLWTTESLQNHLPKHIDQLSYIVSKALRSSSEPLMMILQEAWHERMERVSALATALFEGSVTSSLYFARPSVCWALSQGKPTAVVLDCGHSHTTAAAVCDGYVTRRSIITAPIAGAAVTSALQRHIDLPYERTLPPHHLQSDIALHDVARYCAIQELKEVWSVVGGGSDGKVNPGGPVPEPAMRKFIAPDGAELKLSESASRAGLDVSGLRESCFEVLFREPPLHSTVPGQPVESIHIPRMILKVRRNVDIEMRAASLPHILCGGTSQAPRFAARVTAELKALDSQYFKAPPPIVAAPNSAWKGASMSAESSAFLPLWITKAEFEEEGTSVLRRKLCY